MTRDLEETLAELGPEYRSVVDRLRAAYEPIELSSEYAAKETVSRSSVRFGSGRVIGWSVGYLVAASLLVFLGLGFFLGRPSPACTNEYSLAGLRTEEAMREMIRTQNADGSWKNDFLTRQNSAALRLCSAPEARVAYKKAMRNLRTRGLL